MFMSNDPSLVGDGNGDLGVVVEDDALAAQAAFEPWIDGAVNEVFLFVRYFFQELVAFFHIDVAGGAGAYPAAIVIEMNIVILRQFEDGFVLKIARNGLGRYARIFKKEFYSSHFIQVDPGSGI